MNAESELIRRNVFYSLLDYLSQPAMMIVAAPLLLKTLGSQQYGAWMLVNSIVATTSGLGGGFGDSATKFISMYRGRHDQEGIIRSLIGSLVINCGLGVLLATGLVAATPCLVVKVFHVQPSLSGTAVTATRIGAGLLLLRFAQAVFVASIRAYERYRPVVLTTVTSRALVVAFALVLSTRGFGLIDILWATLAIEGVLTIALATLTSKLLQITRFEPIDMEKAVRELSSFGVFTWLKSALGVLFSHGDRLMVAALVGTGPLAYFVLCNQLTQPIPALLVAGGNFMFPRLSARSASGNWRECREGYRFALLISIAVVAAIGLPMIVMAHGILALWLGPAVAKQYSGLLIVMTIGNSLLAVSVIPQYVALALGKARPLVWINLAAGISSVAGGYFLIRHIGVLGGGVARLLAGLVSLSVLGTVRTAFRECSGYPPTSEEELSVSFDAARL